METYHELLMCWGWHRYWQMLFVRVRTEWVGWERWVGTGPECTWGRGNNNGGCTLSSPQSQEVSWSRVETDLTTHGCSQVCNEPAAP